jgi:hypothetical protein
MQVWQAGPPLLVTCAGFHIIHLAAEPKTLHEMLADAPSCNRKATRAP